MKSFDLLLNFLWFISSKLINVQQTHVKYINPAWINVEVKVIDIFLLLFTDIYFLMCYLRQSVIDMQEYL